MNLELRSQILANALIIEGELKEIIKILLNVDRIDSKSLGYRQSALSAQTKVDLLFDIDEISKDEYNSFKLFFEIRNQFMHNLDSESFEIVLNRIDGKNRLLKYSNNDFSNSEEQYFLCFQELALYILKCLEKTKNTIIKKRIEFLDNKIKALEQNAYDKALKALCDAIDEATELYQKRWVESFGSNLDIGVKIKNLILGLAEKKIHENDN